jgi:hypothetical protein
MSFVALPPSPSNPEAPATPVAPIANDGFFPDIDLQMIRATGRVTMAVDNDRLRASTIAAMITVERDLAAWAARQRSLGFARLETVPAPLIDGKSRLVHLYTRAVALFAKAELIERLRDYDTTAAGGKAVDELDGAADQLRRDATYAVRDILAVLRINVELI